MDQVGIKHSRSTDVKAWMKKETEEQKKRYKAICDEMDALSDKRDKWVKAFHKRLMTRGFNFSGDMRRVIKPEELPTQPKRKFKVVF